jgi:hypothetical protein
LLCCSKPGTFSSTTAAKISPLGYQAVHLEDLVDNNGFSASFKWFSNFNKKGKVYVATPFGLLLGLLRLKSLDDCPFLKTETFASLVSQRSSTFIEDKISSKIEC